VPVPIRRFAARAAVRVGGMRGAKVALGLRRGSPADAAYLASRTLFSDRQISELCGEHQASLDAAPAGLSLYQHVSWRELSGYMRNTLLRDSDVFSMRHALELRVPFLDREVATAAFQAADGLKVARGISKPLLVAAVKDLLPDEVWNRPKQGFVLPFAEWMRGPLAPDVAATLGDAERLDAIGLDPAAVRDVWAGFQRGQAGMTWTRPWALYSLIRWASANGIERAEAVDPNIVEAVAT
jgi:asparagine synthase (glutamine-hydrolysing)